MSYTDTCLILDLFVLLPGYNWRMASLKDSWMIPKNSLIAHVANIWKMHKKLSILIWSLPKKDRLRYLSKVKSETLKVKICKSSLYLYIFLFLGTR